MNCIHLIQKDTDPKLLPKPEKEGSKIWTSGYWSLAAKTAEGLIGGMIYFHKAQVKPSFLGGEIVGYRVEESGEWKGRIVFRFREESSARGVKTGKEGWAMVMKLCGE